MGRICSFRFCLIILIIQLKNAQCWSQLLSAGLFLNVVRTKVFSLPVICLLVVKSSLLCLEGNQVDHGFQIKVTQFLEGHCVRCHGEKKQKGDTALHDIGMKFDSAEEVRRWLSVLIQLENREMPPEDEKQPSDKERKTIIAGIIRQLHLSGNPLEQLRAAPSLVIM